MVLQVPRDCFHPRIRNSGACASQRKAQRGAESSREDLDFAAANGEPVISHSAGNRGRTLDDVEPVHLRTRRFDFPPISEIAGIADAGCAIVEKIAIEGDDHGRLIESVHGIHIAAKGHPRSLTRRVVAAWFVRIPLCLRELHQQGAHLRGQGW